MEERYSRQQLFKPIGNSGQAKIAESHVMVIGAGALGTSNAESLVRGGVGKITIIDRDYVEWSNLHRQQLFSEEDAHESLPKAIAAQKRLRQVNSQVDIHAYVMDATSDTLGPLLNDVDVLIDATDNFDIRLVINDLMQKHRIPWIYGSCVGSTGMSYTIIPGKTPCLQCLLNAAPIAGATCDTVGVISPVVQIVAAHQTTEVLKLLVEDYQAIRTSLVTFDLWNNQHYTMNVAKAKKENCLSCGITPTYPHLSYEFQTKTEVLCGRDTVQIRPKNAVGTLDQLAGRLASFGEIKQNPYLVSVTYDSYRIVFFQDGRTFVHGTNNTEIAKSIYYRLVG